MAFVREMSGSAFTRWWSLMSPYYTKAYQEMWVGIVLVQYTYFKLSRGAKKAVKNKPAH